MASYGYTFTSGDSVTPTKLNNARTVSEIVNADINASAAIAGTKIAPNFGSQNVVTTGSIGAATTSPTRPLDVVGTARVGASGSANFLLEFGRSGVGTDRSGYITGDGTDLTILNQQNGSLSLGTNNAERMRINAVGNVGIGITNPSAKLEIYDSESNGEYFRAGTAASDRGLRFSSFLIGATNGVGHDINAPHSLGTLRFSTVSTERMRIQADGKVGIGTSSPGYMLDVTGIINTGSNYAVDGVQVVGNRRTGWTAPTGTFNRGTFNSDTVTLPQLAARVHALIDDLAAHGLIDS